MSLEDSLSRLQAAAGDREALTLVSIDLLLEQREPGLREALEAAALPHWFDAPLLAALLDCPAERAEHWLQTLSALPLVERYPARDGYNVHEASRLALRQRLARDERPKLERWSRRAAGVFSQRATANERDDASRIEAIYHRLLAEPEPGAAALDRLWYAWKGRHEPLQALGLVLAEAREQGHLQPAARARALVCLGWIRRASLTLEQRERLALEALGLFQVLGQLAGEMDARDQLGDVEMDRGRLEGALQHYREEQRLVGALLKQAPEDSRWRRDLSVSHNKIGGTYQAQGRLDAALAQYQAGLAIRQALTEQDLANRGWRRELSISHNNIGGIYQDQGRLDAALAQYESDLAIIQALSEQNPANSGWRRDLSVSHNKIGGIHQTQGQLDAALAQYQASLAIRQALAEQDPGNSGWRRDLSISHNNIGRIYQAQGRLDAALAQYQAYQAIMQALTEQDPANSGWRRDLSVSHYRVGTVYQAQGRLAEALAEFRADLAIAEALADLDPGNARWRQDLEATREQIVTVEQAMRGGSSGPAGTTPATS